MTSASSALPCIRHPVSGDVITANDLPPSIQRWTPGRKAILVLAIHAGLINEAEALSRYNLTPAELGEMVARFKAYGVRSLRITRFDSYPITKDEVGDEAVELPADPQPLAPDAPPPPDTVLVVDDVVLNATRYSVSVGGVEVHLPKKEFSILKYLMQRVGAVVSREALLAEFYDDERPELKLIDVFICKLRKKIGRRADGSQYIETRWGRGYMIDRRIQQQTTAE